MNSRQKFILQHFFAVDKVLFDGKRANQVLNEADLADFCTKKGALLSNLHEIYKAVDLDNYKSTKSLTEIIHRADKYAGVALQEAVQTMSKPSAKQTVFQEMETWCESEGLSPEESSKYIINHRKKCTALDHMFLNNQFIKENIELLKDWKGDVLMKAHNQLRNKLVDVAFEYGCSK